MNINSISTGSVVAAVWSNPTRTLTADPATDAVSGTVVWTHATRTLTADPATDAGSGTIAWTHATRTLTADPFTDGGGGTVVWTHATRTLTADPATDAGAAALVWARATRKLTGLGCATAAHQTATTVPASGSVDLQPAAGHVFIGVISGTANTGGTLDFGLWDGTTLRPIVRLAANANGGTMFMADNTVWLRIKNNDAANVGFYEYIYIDIVL